MVNNHIAANKIIIVGGNLKILDVVEIPLYSV